MRSKKKVTPTKTKAQLMDELGAAEALADLQTKRGDDLFSRVTTMTGDLATATERITTLESELGVAKERAAEKEALADSLETEKQARDAEILSLKVQAGRDRNQRERDMQNRMELQRQLGRFKEIAIGMMGLFLQANPSGTVLAHHNRAAKRLGFVQGMDSDLFLVMKEAGSAAVVLTAGDAEEAETAKRANRGERASSFGGLMGLGDLLDALSEHVNGDGRCSNPDCESCNG